MSPARIRKFRSVDLYPSQIPSRLLPPHVPDRPGDLFGPPGDFTSDAELFRKRATAVAALYSAHLAAGPPVMATVWGARIYVHDRVEPDEDLWGEEPRNDVGDVECSHVPVDRAMLDLPGARRAVLDWMHALVLDLARTRGWPTDPFDRAHEMCLADDLRYVVAGTPKTGPDRRHRAIPEYVIDGNGDGWSTVRIETRAGDLVRVAGPWDTPINGFATEALRSLRWTAPDRLTYTPWPDPVAWEPIRQGPVDIPLTP